jgi:chromosome partitioning protein
MRNALAQDVPPRCGGVWEATPPSDTGSHGSRIGNAGAARKVRTRLPLPTLRAAIATLSKRDATYCFIDTAPNRGDENADLFRLADLVLVPVRPSPSDLWAVAATVRLLKQAGTPFLFVVNQATLNANITAQAVASLSHHGSVAETIVATRVPYAAAMTDGRTAPELTPRGPAAVEMASLWSNIKACLHANMHTVKGKARA